MNRAGINRSIAMVLSALLFMALPAFYTQEADASSKTKTLQVITSVTETSSGTRDVAGETQEYSSRSKTTYSYNKKGLRTGEAFSDGSRKEYTLNKKGYTARKKQYGYNGNLGSTTDYTYKFNKNGDPVRIDVVVDSTPQGSYTYKYWSRGVIKEENGCKTDPFKVKYSKKGATTFRQTPKGKSSYKNTYNKKGDVTRRVITQDFGRVKYVTTEKIKYTYNSKGLITKRVINSVKKRDGKTMETRKTTDKFTYNKKGNLTSFSYTTSLNNGTKTYISKRTLQFKYKNVKVPKKYQYVVESTLKKDIAGMTERA